MKIRNSIGVNFQQKLEAHERTQGETYTQVLINHVIIPAGIAGIHDCTDAGGRAPKVGALGDAGAVAETPWMAIPKQVISLAKEALLS